MSTVPGEQEAPQVVSQNDLMKDGVHAENFDRDNLQNPVAAQLGVQQEEVVPSQVAQVLQIPVKTTQVVIQQNPQEERKNDIGENIAAWNPAVPMVQRSMENHTKNNDGAGDIARKMREKKLGADEDLKEAA